MTYAYGLNGYNFKICYVGKTRAELLEMNRPLFDYTIRKLIKMELLSTKPLLCVFTFENQEQNI